MKIIHTLITHKKIVSLILGPFIFILILLLPPPEAFNNSSWKLIALLAWMIMWWTSEATPVAVTALLPIPMMPMLNIASQKEVTSNYGHPLIFLFLGGFIIASAMQHWGLHKRIALSIVSKIGKSAEGIIAGFMLATAFLSMWISNTATTVMMFAVAISIIDFVEKRSLSENSHTFSIALLLSIAYSASIGGIGTLIGTPPNTLLASFLSDSYNIVIDFSTWMKVGIPLVIIMLPITWLVVCKLAFPVKNTINLGDKSLFTKELHSLGKMQTGEKVVLIVFILTALSWMFKNSIIGFTGLQITDTSIAIISSILLFVLPVSIHQNKFTVDWQVTKNIPWAVLFLFGGGLALAFGFKSTGLANEIGAIVANIENADISIYVLATIVCIIFLTEVTSNTATTATFLPILSAVAVGLEYTPLVLAVPAALAASMAFMMPVATPPNAIVFSYEKMHISDMIKAGIWLNIVTILIVYGAMFTLAKWVLGIEI